MYVFRGDSKNQVEFILAVWKKIDIPFNIPLPIVLDESFSLLKYSSSFSRSYHVYKDRWQRTVGDDTLHCEEEKTMSTTIMQLRCFTIIFFEHGWGTHSALLE